MNLDTMKDFLSTANEYPQLRRLDNADLSQAKAAFDFWSHNILPKIGVNEDSVNFICCIIEATYCLGYAAGKKATMLSNWQVAGEDKE